MDIELTKDAHTLICLMYKEYCQKVKSGIAKEKANYFSDSEEIQRTLAPKWSHDYTFDICSELCTADLIDGDPGDDMVNDITFTRTGILFMETRFKRGLEDIRKYLDTLSNFLPF